MRKPWKRSMDAAGIDVSVLQPVATKPGQVKPINDWQGQADGVRDVKSLGLPAEAEEAILGGNARRLLGL